MAQCLLFSPLSNSMGEQTHLAGQNSPSEQGLTGQSINGLLWAIPASLNSSCIKCPGQIISAAIPTGTQTTPLHIPCHPTLKLTWVTRMKSLPCRRESFCKVFTLLSINWYNIPSWGIRSGNLGEETDEKKKKMKLLTNTPQMFVF